MTAMIMNYIYILEEPLFINILLAFYGVGLKGV